jgi:hypothetical protein
LEDTCQEISASHPTFWSRGALCVLKEVTNGFCNNNNNLRHIGFREKSAFLYLQTFYPRHFFTLPHFTLFMCLKISGYYHYVSLSSSITCELLTDFHVNKYISFSTVLGFTMIFLKLNKYYSPSVNNVALQEMTSKSNIYIYIFI